MRIKEITRDSDGQLPAYRWPGGYPVYYYTRKGSPLCSECATKEMNEPDEILDDPVVDGDVYWEGPAIECDGGCGRMLESAYGDPDEDNDHDNP